MTTTYYTMAFGIIGFVAFAAFTGIGLNIYECINPREIREKGKV
ncbi:hypothetical protein HMPREF0581_1258 [Mogibacterium timidum ATCC 33093]|uniref:Uncharacterized protein n=1 Tax=Mogibacterium timidum ATCC 33093 TaxID=1401079 RepID=X8J838_9FIRM|nr:hypothetical protein HMPREF0581_1258 [Mogibacterium timidum ATCC 33093]